MPSTQQDLACPRENTCVSADFRAMPVSAAEGLVWQLQGLPLYLDDPMLMCRASAQRIAFGPVGGWPPTHRRRRRDRLALVPRARAQLDPTSSPLSRTRTVAWDIVINEPEFARKGKRWQPMWAATSMRMHPPGCVSGRPCGSAYAYVCGWQRQGRRLCRWRIGITQR